MFALFRRMIDPMALVFVLMPVPFWFIVEPRYVLALAIITACCLLAALIFEWRYVRSRQDRVPAATRHDTHWTADLSPTLYKAMLTLFLRTHGWRILHGEVTGAERVALVAEKDRTRAALLCVPPDGAPDREDSVVLDALASEWAVAQRGLVARERPGAGQGTPGTVRLRYGDLADPDEVLAVPNR